MYQAQIAGAASASTDTIIVEKASKLVYAGEQTSIQHLYLRRASAHPLTGNA